MKGKRKVVVGGIILLAIVVALGVVIFFAKSDDAKKWIDDSVRTSKEDDNSKEEKKKQKDKKEEDKKEKEEDAKDKKEEKEKFVDNRGASVSGTGAKESGSIKMSDRYTFSDPSNISFDKRYVLYGDSKCTPARAIASTKYNCKGVYVVLYAKDGKAMGEYKCYVMNNESDAQGLTAKLSEYYDGGGMSCGHWNDVVYIYSDGNYVQTSINTYYKQGSIKSATPEAYLGMGFYFGGMSEYKVSSSPNGNAGGQGTVVNPTPAPEPTPVPVPTPEPNPDDTSEKSVAVTADKLTDKMEEGKTGKAEAFDIPITNKYTVTDPEALDYDERYVLYGGNDCGSIAAATQNGIEACAAYDVYYLKDHQLVGAYRYIDTKDEANAKKAEAIYVGMGTVTISGKVVCVNQDVAFVQSMIAMLVQYQICAEATPEAYMQYLTQMENYNFYKHADAPVKEEKSILVASDKLTDQIGEAKTRKADAFAVAVTDRYTIRDPEALDYDERYVLYGGINCGSVIAAGQMEIEACGAYDVYYLKDHQLVGAYRYIDAKDEANAKKAEATYATMGTVTISGKVVCVNQDIAFVQSMIAMLVQYQICAEATPEAYMQYLIQTENYKYYKNPNPVKEPEPGEALLVKMSDRFTYDETQILPPSFSYDTRHVLYGDSTCPYASLQGAAGFYEILYCSENRAIMEIKAFVVADEAAAGDLAEKFVAGGMYAMAVPNTDVVLVLDSGVQSTIENYASAGWLTEATPTAYLNGLFLAAGMTEYVK